MNTIIKKLTFADKQEAQKVIVDALYEDEYYSVAPRQDLIDLYDIILDIAYTRGSVLGICDQATNQICGVAVFVDTHKIKDDAQIFDFVLGVENEAFAAGVEAFNKHMLEDESSTYLYGIGVDANFRGNGLGSQLLLGAKELLVNQTVYADVTHDSVLPFYQQLGFEVVPIENMFLIKLPCKKA